jgi:HK97 family phage prohead protease
MKTERRYISATASGIELRASAGEGKPATLAGYGAVYYDGTPATEYVFTDEEAGEVVERIMPGAFAGAVASGADVRGLFNHDSNMVLGRTTASTMTLVDDEKGLRYDIALGDTTVAKDVAEHVRRGDVSGSSFSFAVNEGGETWREEKGRTIRELRSVATFDVGPVTFPAYAGTSTSIRSDGNDQDTLNKAKEFRKMQTELKTKLAGIRQRAEQVTGEKRAEMEGAAAGGDIVALCKACVEACKTCTQCCRDCVDACAAVKGEPDQATQDACKECIRFCRVCIDTCWQCLGACANMLGGDYARSLKAEMQAEKR